jgi:hypothetical protein
MAWEFEMWCQVEEVLKEEWKKQENGTPLFPWLGEDVTSKGSNLFWFSFVYSSTRMQGR